MYKKLIPSAMKLVQKLDLFKSLYESNVFRRCYNELNTFTYPWLSSFPTHIYPKREKKMRNTINFSKRKQKKPIIDTRLTWHQDSYFISNFTSSLKLSKSLNGYFMDIDKLVLVLWFRWYFYFCSRNSRIILVWYKLVANTKPYFIHVSRCQSVEISARDTKNMPKKILFSCSHLLLINILFIHKHIYIYTHYL